MRRFSILLALALVGCPALMIGTVSVVPEAHGAEFLVGRVHANRAHNVLKTMGEVAEHQLTPDNVSGGIAKAIGEANAWVPTIGNVGTIGVDLTPQDLKNSIAALGSPKECLAPPLPGTPAEDVPVCFVRWIDPSVGEDGCEDILETCGKDGRKLCNLLGGNDCPGPGCVTRHMEVRGSKTGNHCTSVCHAPLMFLRVNCR